MNFDDKLDRSIPCVIPATELLADALKPFLQGRSVTRFEPLPGGFVNVNLKFQLGDTPLVLRLSTKPRGDVEAEMAVMQRLAPDVPIPEILYVDLDHPVVGRHLLVLNFMDGQPLHQVEDAWERAQVEAFARELGATLAAIHRHELPQAGLLGPNLSIAVPFPKFGSALVAQMRVCLDAAEQKRGVTADEAARIRAFINQNAGLLEPIEQDRRIVHADFNQKNILVRPTARGWTVSAILDWEFACAGSPLLDLGNFFRFEDEMPAGYQPALVEGYRAAGGTLPDNWRRMAKFTDLVNQLQFLAETDRQSRTFATALRVIRRTLDA